ncbi:hypothetical protein PNEG_04344 [Pneumocystis murina B123]|uniref:Arrestin C-terminal-like domain-containing protein n=1 Tax=Pneumocystis murina (strain B123) TaxID=1069680 RepID=A0A0W4ZWT5_PNEMU|nr:hypothetical protein PNEG_04344 [Pneumocystis murina B123]KTW32843.1 hypothetical protein PNEG_04344 [Pneumocystis murina B123]
MNISGRLPHVISLFDIRLQTPLPNIIILRGNDTEAEGVTVNGSVVFSLNDSISVESIMFRFYGVNKVKWTEVVMSSARMPVERNQKQMSLVFEKKISFLPFHGTKTIGKGNYEFPFEIHIPGDIPESIEPYEQGESMAFLIYKMKVTIKRPRFLSNIIHRKHVRIIRTMPPFSLNFIHTMYVEDTWINKIEYNINIPTKTYELGTMIPINMRFVPLIKNLKISKISCSLREYITLKITSGYHGIPSKYEIARQISASKIKNLPENENEWKLQKTVNIPSSLSSCIQNCDVKHIKVRHKLKIVITLINPDGHISELRASLPIVLLIPPAMFVSNEHYAYPSAMELQLPSYNSHVYDRIWDGVSSIHTNQSFAHETIAPSHIIDNSTNSTYSHDVNPTRSLSNDLEGQQYVEELQNAIQDQENDHNQANNHSSQYFIPSNTPYIILPTESTNQTSLQESEIYHNFSRPFSVGTNGHSFNAITDTGIQQTHQQGEDIFFNDFSQVPSYYTANHPASITATPISQSLPTYEASVSLPQQNTNQISTRQPQQTLRHRLFPLKLHTNRFFKVLFIRHRT